MVYVSPSGEIDQDCARTGIGFIRTSKATSPSYRERSTADPELNPSCGGSSVDASPLWTTVRIFGPAADKGPGELATTSANPMQPASHLNHHRVHLETPPLCRPSLYARGRGHASSHVCSSTVRTSYLMKSGLWSFLLIPTASLN